MQDGFIAIPNKVEDALLRLPITQRQERVFRAVLRKTIGYGKDSDCIATSQIAEITGFHESHIRQALIDLADMGMIARGKRTKFGTFLTPLLAPELWVSERAKTVRLPVRSHQSGTNKRTDLAPHKRQVQQTVEPNGSLSPAVAIDSGKRNPAKREPVPAAEMLALYNQVLGSILPIAQQMNDGRKKALAARWREMLGSTAPNGSIRYTDKESGLAWWAKLFAKVKLNPHWLGENDNGWTANLDWIIGPKNFVKVLEYRARRRGEN